ncbi:MAG TPA: arylamine N-acetyltransferase [Chloroflexota bacterium]|nr:arylamine N-acetyltransferase [Chloroflexota bacterium]
MIGPADVLSRDIVERVLLKLGVATEPAPNLEGLSAVYRAWCQRVPFDNVKKLIHLGEECGGPFPGDDANDFFDSWLRHGTGGTCWAGNGALFALLNTLGFAATRGIATMMRSPNTPPNHGTVVVELDGSRYLVDASILHGEPLRLEEAGATATAHPAWGVRCELRDGRWNVAWLPLTAPERIFCRVERLGASADEFRRMHESTRSWSLFNYALSARVNRRDAVVGAGLGRRVTITATGAVTQQPLSPQERARLLIDEIGMSEEIVSRLPPDRPTPPPPWAATSGDGSATED